MTTDNTKDSPGTPFGIPGAGNLHEVMDSMQKAWGFNSATPMTPTLDIDEIDRRLQDLNTISQWLSLNQNMLQSTIQTLQVQRATLAAIQSFGSAAESKGDAEAVSPMDVMQAFTKMFAPAQSAPTAGASTSGGATGKPSTGASGATSASSPTGASGGNAKPGAEPAAAADPQQWWAMLQNQFAQLTNAALSAQKAATQAASPKNAASSKTAKPKSSRKPTKSKSS
ncbi:MAG: PhaM family polyhydroxyalkanoate granule multifunctional regulatory protein [Burkholderiaceae bacterium]